MKAGQPLITPYQAYVEQLQIEKLHLLIAHQE